MFEQIKRKVPSVLISRCFALEPTDAHQDNVQDIILFPNQVGEMLLWAGLKR